MFAHRLLLLAETFPPSVGGIESYLSGLWGALPTAQSFVVAAAQRGDRDFDCRQPYRVTRAPGTAWTYPRWRRFWRAAEAIVRREQIEALVCGKALFEGRAARRLQHKFGIPYVVCTYAMELGAWLRGVQTRRDLLEVLNGASRILVISEGAKKLLRRQGIPDSRLVKLYPGVREEYFSAITGLEDFQRRFRLAGKRVLVSISRLVPRKGQHVLLQAFAQVRRVEPAAHLLLVGEGPERRPLEALARDLTLTDAVTFTGTLSDDDVRRALAVAEVFALIPIEIGYDVEGFGIVYLEAAAQRLPSVGSHTGGVPESVLDGETGVLVPPGDVDATASALLRLMRDDKLRSRLGLAARARADREFHLQGRALVFQGMIESVLSENVVDQ